MPSAGLLSVDPGLDLVPGFGHWDAGKPRGLEWGCTPGCAHTCTSAITMTTYLGRSAREGGTHGAETNGPSGGQLEYPPAASGPHPRG